MDEPTSGLDRIHDTWPHRTPLGATWRGVTVLSFTVVAVAASAWLGSKLVQYDDRAVTIPTGPVAVVVGALVGAWLRARNGFLGFAMIGSLVAAQSAAYLLHDGYVSLQRPYLAHSSWATYEASLLALGSAAVLVAIVWGTLSGYRRPRPFQDKKRPEPDGPAEAEETDSA
ncbi:hypothetical protein [Streptomyces sp. R41]|uniref:Integral membrane protein n=1 Tax=Streptomyces sp. R41 TaxID=3238632 RepID=A0AB39RLX6_9ACTN